MISKVRKTGRVAVLGGDTGLRGGHACARGRDWSAASLAAARAFRGFMSAGARPRVAAGGRKRPAEIVRLVAEFYLG